jgi:DNA modification methylase
MGIPWMTAFGLRNDGWYLRQDMIWNKPNPQPESVKDRCTKAHEYIFLLTKSPHYFFDYKAIQEPAAYDGRKDTLMKGGIKYKRTDETGLAVRTMAANPHERWKTNDAGEYVRNKRSVWTVATKPYPGSHFATFPAGLIRPCILAGCPTGGTVLDPFGGSGTTGEVAAAEGRNAILIELNPNYTNLMRNRCGLFVEQ